MANNSKVIFNTYNEALKCSKQLAMDTHTTVKVNRDGNTWWIDDPRVRLDGNDGYISKVLKEEVQTTSKKQNKTNNNTPAIDFTNFPF